MLNFVILVRFIYLAIFDNQETLPCLSATCAVHGNGLSSIYEQSPSAKIFDEPFTFKEGSTKIC